MRNALNRSIAAKGQLPQVSVSWTTQELMKLAKLLSGRPAAPTLRSAHEKDQVHESFREPFDQRLNLFLYALISGFAKTQI
jgi:hypothetical protein